LDAIPQIGVSLLLLLPGLAAYCALYGVFGTNKLVSTVPRDPKSVEALTVILLSALLGHVGATAVASLFTWPCVFSACKAMVSLSPQPMDAILQLASAKVPGRADLATAVTEMLVVSAVMFVSVNLILVYLQRSDRLPYWLYRWTAQLANRADAAHEINLAYVLTTIDLECEQDGIKRSSTVLYAGIVDDLAVDDAFNICRIVLIDCERHIVDLSTSFLDAIARGQQDQTNALIPRLALEAKIIRNVSFERIDVGADEDTDDALGNALARLYAA
jgi:hypothetical protein